MKIYAVDDEPLMLKMLTRAIKEVVPECELESFTNSIKLLEKSETDIPDVVFLDIEMPGMNGISLAKALKEINPKINLIFATGYSQYGMDAFKMYASGYILKPVDSEEVKEALSNLRYSFDDKMVDIKTFGNFSVFVKGNPVKFRLSKSKELLAFLVDRDGGVVSKKEVAAVIYEDDDYSRKIQNELGRAAQWLEEDLKEANISAIFVHQNGNYNINKDLVNCDLYDYLSGKDVPYNGEYMEQYSWGEDRKMLL